jgi:protein-S-isoprenylcysteine O-methyltransferase Ste14
MTNNSNPKVSLTKMFFTFIYILIFPALLLFISGDWLWVEGWIFSIWFIILCYSAIIYLIRNDPALLNERYKQPGFGNQAGWDVFVVIGLVIGFIAWIVIMPLDAKRYTWTINFPVWVKVLGLIGLLFSFILFYRSYTDNAYLSPLVRVQEERGQQVVSTGVYGIVRHPMYLGGVLLFVGTPMLLGSVYGLFIGLALILLVAGRIIGEEKLLVEELDGYEDYKKKVKYRLIPWLW